MAPPEKNELACLAIRYGAASLSVGLLIAVGSWLVRRFTGNN